MPSVRYAFGRVRLVRSSLRMRPLAVTVLASGSAGNATLFTSDRTSVLVDGGVAPRTLETALEERGLPLPDAIVVTHAHQDHVGEAPRIAKRLRIPLYVTRATAKATLLSSKLDVRTYDNREPFAIGDLELAPLPVPHDAAQVALTISDGHACAGIVTDLGEIPPGLAAHLAGCDVLLIESNHDVAMLERGPYPEFLKNRMRSARGHLSNLQTHALLRRVTKRTHTVVLMHLSRTNNREDLALETARDALPARVEVMVAPARGLLHIEACPPNEARKMRQLSLFAG